MATYRYGKWTDWSGVTFFNVEKKTLFGWSEEKYWIISRMNGLDKVCSEESARENMMECVDRLVKAGHTVL